MLLLTNMFEFAKIAGFLISPLTVALLLGLLAIFCAWAQFRKTAVALALTGIIGLWAAATPALAYLISFSLEKQYPAVAAEASPKADAIVLLGGGVSGASPPLRPVFDMGAAADRAWHAAALYRAGKASRIIVTGGNQPGMKHIETEAAAMAQMLKGLGVPESAILHESKSRNTHENARFTRILLESIGARRVLLVTSAQHMPRSIRTFAIHLSGSKIVLIPASTDIESLPNALHPVGRYFPDARSLATTTAAIKEYAGLISLYVLY